MSPPASSIEHDDEVDDDDMGVIAGFLFSAGNAGPTLMRIILLMLLLIMLLAVIGLPLLDVFNELVGGDVDDDIDDMDVRDDDDDDEHDGGDEIAES